MTPRPTTTPRRRAIVSGIRRTVAGNVGTPPPTPMAMGQSDPPRCGVAVASIDRQRATSPAGASCTISDTTRLGRSSDGSPPYRRPIVASPPEGV
jgi:hypothetical protein